MSEIEFKPWPKIARLNRTITITEKIDGTNAAIGVTEDGEVYAQSRTRIITPAADNFGFATWVHRNSQALAEALGQGLHFGEWWGSGIQRGYGLASGERRFSLFNTERWPYEFTPKPLQRIGDDHETLTPYGVDIYSVPVLYRGPFDSDAIDRALDFLRERGSAAAPGFMKPEGVVVYMHAARTMFKVTLENDGQPKGMAA